jgi:hypothetical protein
MADPLLHQNATVMCVHLPGKAEPAAPNQRVKVSNQATVTQSVTYSISGCSKPPQSGPPCATAQFTTAATRVRSNGVPLLLKTSEAKCVPTGTGLNVLTTQIRVKAT